MTVRADQRRSARSSPAAARHRAAGRPVLDALEGRRLFSAGELDPAFGAGGVGAAAFGGIGTAAGLDVQGGKTVVAGNTRARRPARCWRSPGTTRPASWTQRSAGNAFTVSMRAARYNADGTFDTTFGGGDGVAAVRGPVGDLTADNKLVVSGGVPGSWLADGLAPFRYLAAAGASAAPFTLGPDGTLAVAGTRLRNNIGVTDTGAGGVRVATYDFDVTFPRVPVARVTVDAGAGNDLVAVRADDFADTFDVPATVYGGAGNDSLTVRAASTRVYGEAGNDKLGGGPGYDQLDGGTGDDEIYGDPSGATVGGDDLLVGGDGNDFLYGGTGRDRLYGGNGDDTLDGAGDYDTADYLEGGAGYDQARKDSKDAVFSIEKFI